MDSLNPNTDCEKYNPFANKQKGATYNQEQLDYIYELLNLNWTPNKIAKEYSLDVESIKRRIKNNDWKAHSNRNANLSNTELQEIKILVDAGAEYDTICKQYKITLTSLLYRIANNKWERTKRKTKYTFDENFFDEINTEHKAYWLGFLYADGYILTKRTRRGNNESQSFGFAISETDIELAKKFKEDLHATNPINLYKSSGAFANNNGCCRILLTSQHTVDMLKKWGLTENKTFTLTFPDFLSEDLIPHFIRGYSDGDGSITNYQSHNAKKNRVENKSSWKLCGTKELLDGIKHFFKYDHLKLSQRWPERHNNNYNLDFSGINNCLEKLDIIYKDATIYLQRKYDKYAEMQGRKKV